MPAILEAALDMADKADHVLAMAEISKKKREIESETNSRLAAIVDSSFDAIISKDLNSVITSWNAAAERLFGYSREEAVGQSILMLIPDDRHAEETTIIDRVSRGQRVETFETIRRRKDGRLVPVSVTVSPVKDASGVIVGASKIARDISEAKESERRIRLLMREVNHRVKNQFAVILSMVRETAKRTVTPGEFEHDIRSRIMALSKSHDLLVSSEWAGASLFDLVQEHLRPFGHDAQVLLSGPLLTLQPNAVQYLGIALHELGTNSAKYGALSGSVGRISIEWHVQVDAEGREEVLLLWDETFPSDGVAAENERSGFGTVVLRRIAPQAVSGSAVLERTPGHVRWTLTAPSKYVVTLSLSDELGASAGA